MRNEVVNHTIQRMLPAVHLSLLPRGIEVHTSRAGVVEARLTAYVHHTILHILLAVRCVFAALHIKSRSHVAGPA